jgi:hypothetical protein
MIASLASAAAGVAVLGVARAMRLAARGED